MDQVTEAPEYGIQRHERNAHLHQWRDWRKCIRQSPLRLRPSRGLISFGICLRLIWPTSTICLARPGILPALEAFP